MNQRLIYLIVFVLSFVLTVILTKITISIMQKRKLGQIILTDGPKWHMKKEGTPTMGGLAFVLSTSLCFIFFIFILMNQKNYDAIKYSLSVYIYAISNAFIGVFDDILKARKKQNKGLDSKSKFFLQSIVAIIFILFLAINDKLNTVLKIPFINFEIDIGIFSYILVFFVLCGFVNAVNLTDGIDGLASSTVLTTGILFSIVSLFVVKSIEISFFSAVLVGVLIAFLLFNHHPAKIFMGDTGSLFLGAIVVSFSILIDNILLVLLYGIIFLIEAISVILQVVVFKVKGKRLFKMAPLHHHFEKKGWGENKIVFVFSLINLFACILTLCYLL